ncbi:protein TPX2 [Iris pallida]|uniref:Protein TPX2 n=1 Tax=Iris pallida TaxID=29817 RepID=A0AAX6H2S0_IRIPA|nr:protein TPX2 [Iris pallida]
MAPFGLWRTLVCRDENDIPRLTVPNSFHLHTEERGLGKERQFLVQILEKQIEDEKARVPKANPYPYTTDYPVIPPKPQPKQCTKPEAFQLESLVRHEEKMQRKQENKVGERRGTKEIVQSTTHIERRPYSTARKRKEASH